MRGMLGELPGILAVECVLPAKSSGDNSAIEGVVTNPFYDKKAYVERVEFIPIATITGDNTNSESWEILVGASTEIANLDFTSGVDGAAGTPQAFTISGTAAQRLLAAQASVKIQRTEVGTQPARIFGHKVRVWFKAAGV